MTGWAESTDSVVNHRDVNRMTMVLTLWVVTPLGVE